MSEVTLTLTIDGITVRAEKDETILMAAQRNGIEIPTLCYIKDLAPDGSCRFCMVEVKGGMKNGLVTACTTECMEGMEVQTHSAAVVDSRKYILNLLLSNHETNCFSCLKNRACKLQDFCYEYGVEASCFSGKKRKEPIDDSNPFFTYNPNLCINCRKCLRVCAQLQGRNMIAVHGRGFDSMMSPPFEAQWKDSICELCGNCVEACPTEALAMNRRKNYRPWQVKKVLTTCPHCAVGCQFYLKVRGEEIVDVTPEYGPSNRGMLCVKGRSGSFDFVKNGERLKYPLIKNKETGEFERAGWDEALTLVAEKFMELKKQYGPDCLAGFACSRAPNEDIYLFQKMVRCCFGTNNVDNCARLCHSASVTGLSMTLGSGAMTNPIYDITHDVDAILLVGSNPEEAHPVVGMQIRQAVRNGTKLIVADPRDIDLAKSADVHLKLRPGTNVAFANGMMHIILQEGLADQEFIDSRTEGFEALQQVVLKYTPEYVAGICHIEEEDLKRAARIYAKAGKAPIIYCLGVTEHSAGTEGVMCMSNLAMLVGKIGRPGCGVNPLRGQNNVQGACDMGALPDCFPGYQKVENSETLEKFEKAWGIPLSHANGLCATDVLPEALNGKIKGLFIFGEDPMMTDPDTSHVTAALKSLDFLVVSELFMTDTAKMADVVLPGVSYAEKEGTFTNTERRVQRVRRAVKPIGEARPDTDIITDLMNRMGYEQPLMTASEIMDEIAGMIPSFGGISHRRLDLQGGLQWPCRSAEDQGTAILHVGSFSRGLGRFYPAEYMPSAELPDETYPLVMMTGRILCQYNARAMTGKTDGLSEMEGSSYIEMNKKDAVLLNIRNGERVRVSSRRGTIETTARVGRKVSQGETWMPFHFADGNCNLLTNAALDRYARIPEYKVCAVRVEKR